MKREVEELLSSSLSHSFLSEGLLTGGEGEGRRLTLFILLPLSCPLLYRVLNCIWPQNVENLREGRGDELSGVIRRKEDEEEGV